MMKRLCLLLCIACAAAACENSDDAPGRLDLSSAEILLRGDAAAPNHITVEASGEWTARIEGTGFTAEPLRGEAGTTTVAVKALAPNRGSERTKLGSLIVQLDGSQRSRRAEVLQSPQTAPQSVFLYMEGTDLLRFFKTNIDRSLRAVDRDTPGDGRFLAMIQPRKGEALIIEIAYDSETQAGRLDTLRRYTNIITTRRETIARLLAEMAEMAPAERYGLILGSHGTGWVPASHPYLAPGRAGAQSDYWIKQGALATRWFGSDDNVRTDISDLAGAIGESCVRFEYLIFDACFLSSVEALYDLKASADYIVASPTEIMGHGFPYDRIVPHLFLQGGTAYDLQQVCRTYYEFYLNDWDTLPGNARSGCIALTVCGELDGLAEAMKTVLTGPTNTVDPAALQYFEGLSPHLFFDLGQYVELLCNDPARLDAFRRQFDKTFPEACRFHTPTFYSAYGIGSSIPIREGAYSGVSVSEPSSRYVTENRQTAWYRATHR